ncbi:MAG TPA: hypothetical protein HA224_01425 [Nanoarchaeota archaeon]|nr:hypothetical protein [Nanoarchaeota archaeon]
MDALGTFVKSRYALKTTLSLEAVAERLASPAQDYNLAEPPKQVGGGYLIKALYKDVSVWRPVDIQLWQGEGKVLFSIQIPLKDGRSEKHMLNEVARLLEDILKNKKAT